MGESAEVLYDRLVHVHSVLTSLYSLLNVLRLQDDSANITSPPSAVTPAKTEKVQENGNLPFEPNHNHISSVSFLLSFLYFSICSAELWRSDFFETRQNDFLVLWLQKMKQLHLGIIL